MEMTFGSKYSSISLRGSLDHRHDAGLDRLGQVGSCIDDVGQVGVIQVPGTDPTVRWRSRCPFEGGRSSRRQPGLWGSSTSFYPLTYERPVGWDGASEGSPRPPKRPIAGS